MLRRLIVLQLLIAGGLSLMFQLPKAPPIQPSAILVDAGERPELPNMMILSGWHGGPKISPAERELAILANDTNFARRNYYRSPPDDYTPGTLQTVQASIVLSGKDLNNSLHRPERCLPAQGLNILSSTVLPVPLKNGKVLNLTKLHCTGAEQTTNKPYVHLNYYWFVGHNTVKHTHYGRTIQDMRDRLIEGYDQRWAYVTLSLNLVTGRMQDETGREYNLKALTEEEADRMVVEFAAELAPEIMKEATIKSWD